MIVDLLPILSKQGTSIVDRIKNNLANTGTDASGQTSRSLRYEVKQSGSTATLKIIGRPYFMVVETGRKPTPQYTAPSQDFVNRIKQWLSARGKDDKGAYGIALSIHKKGTDLWRKGGRKDIVSNVINVDTVEAINKDILSKFSQEYIKTAVATFDGNRIN